MPIKHSLVEVLLMRALDLADTDDIPTTETEKIGLM